MTPVDTPHGVLRITTETWALGDSESERALRQVAALGPYFGEPAVKYVVTGPGCDDTKHASLSAAMAAAEPHLPRVP